jgi:hypothetical protein
MHNHGKCVLAVTGTHNPSICYVGAHHIIHMDGWWVHILGNITKTLSHSVRMIAPV